MAPASKNKENISKKMFFNTSKILHIAHLPLEPWPVLRVGGHRAAIVVDVVVAGSEWCARAQRMRIDP